MIHTAWFWGIYVAFYLQLNTNWITLLHVTIYNFGKKINVVYIVQKHLVVQQIRNIKVNYSHDCVKWIHSSLSVSRSYPNTREFQLQLFLHPKQWLKNPQNRNLEQLQRYSRWATWKGIHIAWNTFLCSTKNGICDTIRFRNQLFVLYILVTWHYD